MSDVICCLGPVPTSPPTHSSLTLETIGKCTVTVDGADVTSQTRQARVGTDGWVELFRPDLMNRRRICGHERLNPAVISAPCPLDTVGEHPAIEYRTGTVVVEVES